MKTTTTILAFLFVIILMAIQNHSFAQDKTATPVKKIKSGLTQKTTPSGPRGGGGQGGSQPDTTVVHPISPRGGRTLHLDSLHRAKMNMKKAKAN